MDAPLTIAMRLQRKIRTVMCDHLGEHAGRNPRRLSSRTLERSRQKTTWSVGISVYIKNNSFFFSQFCFGCFSEDDTPTVPALCREEGGVRSFCSPCASPGSPCFLPPFSMPRHHHVFDGSPGDQVREGGQPRRRVLFSGRGHSAWSAASGCNGQR